MKLELKHLAPYLPHDIEICQQISRNIKGTVDSHIVTYGKGKIFSYLGAVHPYIKWDNGRTGIQETFLNTITSKSEYFLVLRPISDLAKDINIDGKVFNLRDDLIKRGFVFPNHTWNHMITEWPYWVIDKLFEYHFDVFNLIDKELAIDINKIKNQPDFAVRHTEKGRKTSS